MIALADTPSGGEFELLRALRLSRAYGGNDVTPARVKRHLPKRTSVTEVTSALGGLSGTNVHSSSGKYSLTAAGLLRSRQNRPRRSPVYVT